jgi:prepilin-type N-terminal cleavage/methylation domain-containing protein
MDREPGKEEKKKTNVWKRLARDSRGFTLIELSTVVVIISTLATMIVENVQNARTRAKRVACVVNQRNIFEASLLYGADAIVPTGNTNVNVLVAGGYVPEKMADCPAGSVDDDQDYVVFFVGGNPASVTCQIKGFEHPFSP